MHAFDDLTGREFARIAGLLYLLIAAAGFFPIFYVPGELIVPGDPLATAARIADRPGIFAAGLAVGGTGYFMDSLRAFVFPGSDVLFGIGLILLAVVVLAEIGFALWLLVRGRIAAPSFSVA